MYQPIETHQFVKASKRMLKRGKPKEKLDGVIRQIAAGEPLPPKFRDHRLIGDYAGYRECHIEPDWLLIYKVDGDTFILVDTGTHADLFG